MHKQATPEPSGRLLGKWSAERLSGILRTCKKGAGSGQNYRHLRRRSRSVARYGLTTAGQRGMANSRNVQMPVVSHAIAVSSALPLVVIISHSAPGWNRNSRSAAAITTWASSSRAAAATSAQRSVDSGPQ
jgi:hypothetical protein